MKSSPGDTSMIPNSQTQIRVVDRHPGWGKTTAMIDSLKYGRKVAIFTPYLDEVADIINEAKVPLVQPSSDQGSETKFDDLEDILLRGQSFVSTHAMFSRVGELAKKGLLMDYDVIIDEVVDIARICNHELTLTKNSKDEDITKGAWRHAYVGNGYVTIDPDTGEVSPTPKWDAEKDQIKGNYSLSIYEKAKSGNLFVFEENILLWRLPPVIFKATNSVTVYTYRFEGSFLHGYFLKNYMAFVHDKDEDADRAFRERLKRDLDVRMIPGLSRYQGSFTYSGQTAPDKNRGNLDRAVQNALRGLARSKGGLGEAKDLSHVMITCAKSRWFKDGKDPRDAKGNLMPSVQSGSFSNGTKLLKSVNFVPNTTRGTDKFAHCSHMIYLYEQNPHATIAKYLDLWDQTYRDLYAISEFLQWLMRSRLRRKQKAVVYLPSQRMRKLLDLYLNEGLGNIITQHTKDKAA